ncbi:MAG: hypothetical protein ACLGI9_14730 [Thermoanaerobaculia bacterium]
MSSGLPKVQGVFLNVPFDPAYERNFVALIATILSLGGKPHCVLEIPDLGEGRLLRILKHLEACQISIHELSRVGTPVRFNMPFELGLACALSVYKGNHAFVLLEKEPYRLDRTLSDLKGRDALIHGGRPEGIINCLLDLLGSTSKNPKPEEIRVLWKQLWRYACDLKVQYGRNTLFHRSLFNELITAGSDFANAAGLIPS